MHIKRFSLIFLFLSLLSVCFFQISSNVSADQIVPSSRVTSYLNVREQANIESDIVGKLRPGESAELVQSVPYWYQVRLDDGTLGFVSKAWSQTVTYAETTGELIRLGSWNIKKLGHGSSKNFDIVAKIIDSNFDVLVVVEVMQSQGGHPGYDTLLDALGLGWSGLITNSPRPKTSAGHSEFYAILYRNGIVRPCNGWNNLIYHTDNDGSSTGSGPDHFSREPAFGCFEAPANNTSIGVDFLLAAYHARWADGNTAEISQEVSHLSEVFTTMNAARQGERDLIIAGDFNLVSTNLSQIISEGIRSEGSGSTLNSQGQITSNLYDHIIVFDEAETSEMIGNAAVLDVRDRAADNVTFYQTISDHLPIVVRLHAAGPDDD